jgi:hypothetical protein
MGRKVRNGRQLQQQHPPARREEKRREATGQKGRVAEQASQSSNAERARNAVHRRAAGALGIACR